MLSIKCIVQYSYICSGRACNVNAGVLPGGHINPAVTFGFFLAQKISLLRGILYIILQVGTYYKHC